ncbi:SOS response-associated peptidase [Psychrobacillus sp. NPDC058041]|uniref:SOS response-associated peptidase n=1 Tax=Psychrobacillus sp. NPDC058041 TaxID=3346310 RepID=UPI0036DBC068
MCGRYTLFANFDTLIERFDIDITVEESLYLPSYNIAPSQSITAVISDGEHNRMGKLKWGLVPSWAKDEKIGYKMINARSETVDDKPSFRQSFIKRRCLIPMDSFFEWKTTDAGKLPMRIKLRSNEVFAVAGLWETWKSPSGENLHSCTLLTTEPNELMLGIHNRMPVIIKRENESDWLNPLLQDKYKLKSLLAPYDAELMEAFPVSSEVNSPKNNHSGLINVSV